MDGRQREREAGREKEGKRREKSVNEDMEGT